ncbi:hypothetical protein J2Y58_004021 [Sphingomonas sp. BE138]|uniref:hypothetical protein n=1 Tax=Sphingomonas sp. BE138 TaxID=2817845 RepID=UPI00285C4E06|nr:hypothetical protein [Sphingomonas sp. BE138]MDR6790638.1 hypothetical protein [Sphingomonas sp. BE138]
MIDLQATIVAHMDEPFASISAKLVKENDAEILWINPRASLIDRSFHEQCGSDLSLYRSHILNNCAYLYVSDAATASATGYFDRYGGDGMGKNGGSGRAVNLGAYNIKGVGRSALVSPMTDFAHASGYAFVEEALREVIMYQALEKVLPEGVVPVLAVIGLRKYVAWPEGSYPPGEYRVLIVRPRIARPAHLELANTYIPIDPTERRMDLDRVIGWRSLLGQNGNRDLLDAIAETYKRWSSRYAKSLLHNWSLGGMSPSNIDVTGRFLDFGGACELPSIGNYAVGYAAWSWDEIKTIKRSISSLVTSMLGTPRADKRTATEIQNIWQDANFAFMTSLVSELGLVAPMERNEFSKYIKTHRAEEDWLIAQAALDFLKNIRIPINQAGGPQLDDVRRALQSARAKPQLTASRKRLFAHFRAECQQSASDVSHHGALPIKHRESLRKSLHKMIIEHGNIDSSFFSKAISRFSDQTQTNIP